MKDLIEYLKNIDNEAKNDDILQAIIDGNIEYLENHLDELDKIEGYYIDYRYIIFCSEGITFFAVIYPDNNNRHIRFHLSAYEPDIDKAWDTGYTFSEVAEDILEYEETGKIGGGF